MFGRGREILCSDVRPQRGALQRAVTHFRDRPGCQRLSLNRSYLGTVLSSGIAPRAPVVFVALVLET